jgi:hypothetical protein
LQEYLNTLTEDKKLRAGVKPGLGIFDDYTVKLFKSRQALARLIRKEQSEPPKINSWYAVIKLGDVEGY